MPAPRDHHSVYVVYLRNPKGDGKAGYYVGLTGLSPEQRFENHKKGIKAARVVRLYGERLAFWGSIDEQRTLPFGTPAEIRREVETRLRTIGRGGGLIIGPTHHVQLDTPLENFRAMVEAVKNTPCV